MNYLENTIKLARYYKGLGERTFEQLSDEDMFWSPGEDNNSIATIVKHLWGNMLSRWTNFLTEDGEKGWRNREAEFVNDITSGDEIKSKWNEGWTCFIEALESLSSDQLEDIIYIRNEGHTIMDAIQRQLSHYPYHIGQIVFIGKMMKGSDWESLSIPRGQSDAYNANKFGQEKDQQHFTDNV
ncbi:MAG: DUF1572 family protein [Cyclobacteriaceae bacterium]